MKKYFLPFLLFTVSLTTINFSFAQGVAVNTTGNTADPSAMLDVNATNKGILIPRVTSTSSITSPVVGLLIFQTTAPIGFYYYDGATWDYLQNSANVTLQGNAFNGNSQLLQLNSTGQIPALNGINITNLNASNITSGTLPAANGGAGNVTGVLYANGSGIVTAATAANYPTLNQNTTGNAATATLASTVTTDANLTGDVTSVGNTTSYNNIVPANKGGAGTINGILEANGAGTVSAASTTGTGNVVLSNNPTLGGATLNYQNSYGGTLTATILDGAGLVGATLSGAVLTGATLAGTTNNLGIPSALVGTNITGTAAGLTAGNVTTDANLTGDVTSVGNATTIGTGKVTIADLVTTGTLPAFNGSNLTNLNASNLATGTVGTARLGTGTASSTTFLEGDGKWATPASGGGSSTLELDAIVNAQTIAVAAGVVSNLACTSSTVAGGTFNNATGTFTVTSAGLYLVTVVVNTSSAYAFSPQLTTSSYTAYGVSAANANYSPGPVGRANVSAVFNLAASGTITLQSSSPLPATDNMVYTGGRFMIVKL